MVSDRANVLDLEPGELPHPDADAVGDEPAPASVEPLPGAQRAVVPAVVVTDDDEASVG